MEAQFYIQLSLKTTQGYGDYGQYFFENDREAAYSLFRQIEGDPAMIASCPLHIDLMETASGLPVKIKSICCTMEELGFNCKLIAKEIFRLKNLDEMS
ncbi:hypothetical protein SAMN05216464_103197 [Mucilaginibacter pineti]|uniref:Uncharacterized protein n=1 Tax=Mucilaginibacter pineti TaxID=1391627 RepID=A0A1G6Z4X1_9SPHI|nr:hypothetical protein [Mucilaginibacter pineti]SDD97007.1 hypothetical protein SAMN05216464_103197 [Mucilaginibacter pineti]